MRRMRRSPTLVLVIVVSSLGALRGVPARAEDRAAAADTPVRSAPFDVAPEIARLHPGDRVCADEQSQGAWRRVGLADGRHGFVREADTQSAPSDPNHHPCAASPPTVVAAGDVNVVSVSSQSPSAQTPAVAVQSQAPRPSEPAEAHLLGVMFELLPVGTLSTKAANATDTTTTDSLFAVAVAPFFDAALSPYVAVGLSPQVIFRVKNDQISEAS